MFKLVLIVVLIAIVPSDALLKKLLLKKGLAKLGSPAQLPSIFSGSNLLSSFGSSVGAANIDVGTVDEVPEPIVEQPSNSSSESVRPVVQSYVIPYYYVPVNTYSVASGYAYPYPYPSSYSYANSEPRYEYGAPTMWK